jgi:hypothetical protein
MPRFMSLERNAVWLVGRGRMAWARKPDSGLTGTISIRIRLRRAAQNARQAARARPTDRRPAGVPPGFQPGVRRAFGSRPIFMINMSCPGIRRWTGNTVLEVLM